MPTESAIGDARRLLERRLADVDEERRRLERALAELGGKAKRAGRPRGKSSTRASKTRESKPGRTPKRRRRRGGTRADQVVGLVTSSPGISATDAAKKMKIKPNYLYRVLGDLEKDGRVKKDGRRYFPAT